MKKYYKNEILFLFGLWRIWLFAVAFLAVIAIPAFGGRFPYANNQLMNTGLPAWVWGFGNFDGVHYLRLVQTGYEGSKFSQAFFPLYPLFLKLTTVGNYYLLSALLLTNLIFLAALYLFYRLLRLDWDKKTSLKTIGLLLAFPTSYYFGAIYSESPFLALVVLSLLLMRQKNFWVAGMIAALASATRVVGLMLVPVLLIEAWPVLVGSKSVAGRIKAAIGLLLAPLGALLYILYLQVSFANPLYFLNAQPEFGAQRSDFIVLLPQVLFRYLKMLLSVPVYSLTYLNVSLELLFTVTPLLALGLFYKKIRFSYWILMLGFLLMPTLTGTFSSMPRYALMTFLMLPVVTLWLGRYYKVALMVLILLQAILLSLFVRGYWVA